VSAFIADELTWTKIVPIICPPLKGVLREAQTKYNAHAWLRSKSSLILTHQRCDPWVFIPSVWLGRSAEARPKYNSQNFTLKCLAWEKVLFYPYSSEVPPSGPHTECMAKEEREGST
ncbi:hypothetical protein B296_00038544, partial [Ensete ventricosum]